MQVRMETRLSIFLNKREEGPLVGNNLPSLVCGTITWLIMLTQEVIFIILQYIHRMTTNRHPNQYMLTFYKSFTILSCKHLTLSPTKSSTYGLNNSRLAKTFYTIVRLAK